VATYSAAKSFVSFLAIGLNYELKDKIDVMNYECGYVRTNMNPIRPLNFFTITAQKAVQGCLANLGHEHTTWGPINHEVSAWYLLFYPT